MPTLSFDLETEAGRQRLRLIWAMLNAYNISFTVTDERLQLVVPADDIGVHFGIVGYFLLLVGGLCGGVSTMGHLWHVIGTRKLKQLAHQLCLPLLCAVDFLTTVDIVPTILDRLFGVWMLAQTGCQLFNILDSLNKITTGLLLLLLAYDQFATAYGHKVKQLRAKSTIFGLTAGIIILSLLLLIPLYWHANMQRTFVKQKINLDKSALLALRGISFMKRDSIADSVWESTKVFIEKCPLATDNATSLALSYCTVGYVLPLIGTVVFRAAANRQDDPSIFPPFSTTSLSVYYFLLFGLHWGCQLVRKFTTPPWLRYLAETLPRFYSATGWIFHRFLLHRMLTWQQDLEKWDDRPCALGQSSCVIELREQKEELLLHRIGQPPQPASPLEAVRSLAMA